MRADHIVALGSLQNGKALRTISESLVSQLYLWDGTMRASVWYMDMMIHSGNPSVHGQSKPAKQQPNM